MSGERDRKNGSTIEGKGGEKKAPEYLKYIEIETLNDIMRKIKVATGLGLAACDFTGCPVAGAVGYCDFCRNVQGNVESKRACEASTAIGEIQAATMHKPYIYACPQGLLEVSIPIDVNGIFMGGVVAGQIYCEDIPESVNRVASMFPPGVVVRDKYPEEIQRCKKMNFNEFRSTAYMLYTLLTEYFKAKVSSASETTEMSDLQEENMKLKRQIKEIEASRMLNYSESSFLLGAVSSLANSAAIEGAEETNEMAGVLSECLAEGLSDDNGGRFLCDEMRIVEKYLLIQKQRIDELEFNIELPESMQLHKIPAMTIYPLIEFSLYCGLMYKEGKKNLSIRAEKDSEYLSVIVEDNGLGMKYEEVKALYPQIAEEYTFDKNRNQIRLLEERLRILFGEDYELSSWQTRGSGTKYLMRIPFNYQKEVD